jgi:hypothetical protein
MIQTTPMEYPLELTIHINCTEIPYHRYYLLIHPEIISVTIIIYIIRMGRTPTRKNNEEPVRRTGGRIVGAKQYHKPTLYDLVAEFRPVSSVLWDVIANQYRSRTGEMKVRENVKRYFVQKCCNNNKKPTGQSAPDPFTEKCQALWRSILASEDASDMGDSGDEEEDEEGGGLASSFGHPPNTQLTATNTQLSTTQLDDSQDPDYRPTFEESSGDTSDSEAEVPVRKDSSISSLRSPTSSNNMMKSKEIFSTNNKSKNVKHNVNQGKNEQ